jgi:hypothetical protein
MTLRTRFSISECRSRLESAVDAGGFAFSLSGYAGSKEILGKIHERNFRLQKRRSYQNSFAPFFYGKFTPSDGGTLIKGEFRLHPFVRAFMAFWFSFLTIFVIAALFLPSGGQPEAAGGRIFMLLTAGLLAVFGIGLVKLGQWLGDSERQTITIFLKRMLEADDVA